MDILKTKTNHDGTQNRHFKYKNWLSENTKQA